MASPAKIVSDLMNEAGKMAPEIQIKMESIVGEVTVDLLSQNGSRFAGLEKSKTLTITTSATSFILPADFRTAQPSLIEQTSDEAFVRELDVFSEREYYRRRADAGFRQDRVCYLELKVVSGSKRWYLTIGASPSSTKYYKFFYWREAQANDTDLIPNETMVKHGVRSNFPELFPNFMASIAIYGNMREKFKEDVGRLSTNMRIRPSLRVERINRVMHKIGRGG